MSRSEEAQHGIQIENQWYDEWVETEIGDLGGKVAVVTGSNSGTGFWAASALAGKGCTVVLACRTVSKAEHAKKDILESFPNANVDVIKLDNMDFSSVREFAKAFDSKYDRLDFLLNNAGIMAQPKIESKDGFDIQFQTNHLAHFLLTQLLWDKIVNTPGQSRIVNHSSSAHHLGGPKFDKNKMLVPPHSAGWFGINYVLVNGVFPLMGLKPVDNWLRYGMSKLCNVLFTKELCRRIEAKSADGLSDKVISLACDPGYASTGLQQQAGWDGWQDSNKANAQSAADGSLPLLMCAISSEVKNGDYCAPEKGMKGKPIVSKAQGNGDDKKMAEELWTYSEECIKAKFEI